MPAAVRSDFARRRRVGLRPPHSRTGGPCRAAVIHARDHWPLPGSSHPRARPRRRRAPAQSSPARAHSQALRPPPRRRPAVAAAAAIPAPGPPIRRRPGWIRDGPAARRRAGPQTRGDCSPSSRGGAPQGPGRGGKGERGPAPGLLGLCVCVRACARACRRARELARVCTQTSGSPVSGPGRAGPGRAGNGQKMAAVV